MRYALLLWGVALLLAIGFIAVAEEAHEQQYFALDYTVRSFAATQRGPTLDIIMRTLSAVGSGYVLIPLGVVAMPALLRRGRRLALAVPLLAIGGGLLDAGMKWLVGRPRPRGHGYGFPSGHTTAAVLFFCFIIYLVWTSDAPRWVRVSVTCLGSLVCLGIAISRVYLDAHWFSDVFGGFLGAGAYLTAVVAWLERRPVRGDAPPVSPAPSAK